MTGLVTSISPVVAPDLRVRTADTARYDGDPGEIDRLTGFAYTVSVAKVEAKRAAILAAAQTCFWRNGIRRTAIEDVAREAEVAKGTVYLYFASKEELFASLASELCAGALVGVRDALAGREPLTRRLAAALDAKIGYFHRLLAGSPHAAELVESKAAVAERSFEALERDFHAALDRALVDARVGGDARARTELLELILAAAYGTARQAELRGESSPEVYRARLQLHLDRLLGTGVRARAAKPRAARARSRAAR
jgi:AcrR family transcriptional regulator